MLEEHVLSVRGTVASKAKDANARAAQLAASPAAAAGAAKWDSSTKAGVSPFQALWWFSSVIIEHVSLFCLATSDIQSQHCLNITSTA